jgi:hypothetical protein
MKPRNVNCNIFFAEQKLRFAECGARSFLKILQSVVVFVLVCDFGCEIENPDTNEYRTESIFKKLLQDAAVNSGFMQLRFLCKPNVDFFASFFILAKW